MGMGNGAATLDISLPVSQKAKHRATIWGHFTNQQKLKIDPHKILVFIAALFVIAPPKWKQLEYPCTDKWINKVW